MGIKDLYKVIESEAPGVIQDYHFSQLSGFHIAVDISIFLYKYIRTAGGNDWVNIFVNFLCKFIKHNIVVVCIFDGPNPPIEKKLEQDSRRIQVAKQVKRMEDAITIRNRLQDEYLDAYDYSDSGYIDTDEIDPELVAKAKELLSPKTSRTIDPTNYYNVSSIIDSLNDIIVKLENQTIPITQSHKDIAFRLVQLMGLHAIQADGEAEAVCSYLAVKGMVHGVLTEDTDCLAYGSPFMFAFKNFKLNDERVIVVHLDSILDSFGFTFRQFLDMCILLKCDYNKHIYYSSGTYGASTGGTSYSQPTTSTGTTTNEGKVETTKIKGRFFDKNGNLGKKYINLGPKKIFDLISTYESYKSIVEMGVLEDPSVVRYERCLEIFLTRPVHENIKDSDLLKKNLEPDIEGIEKLSSELDIFINTNQIKMLTVSTPIIFESDEDTDGIVCNGSNGSVGVDDDDDCADGSGCDIGEEYNIFGK